MSNAKRRLILLALAIVLVLPAWGQPPARPAAPRPKPEAVAETRLLMEGLAQANYRGLDKLLRQPPADVEGWTFARGQALLIAEMGNLLLLRPPRNAGETAWLQQSAELRDSATLLARRLAARDYSRSVTALAALADTCNRCHQTFRVRTHISPPGERKAE
jgi:hypothetical protein